MKELYIDSHMELVEQYQIDHPDADWSEACEATADAAYHRYRDKFADMMDAAKQRAKDEGKWPPVKNTTTR